MFPLRDDIPARRFPLVNLTFIVVNILCFVFEYSHGNALESFIMDWGFVPARFTLEQKRNFFDITRFIPVFSSMFLHGGILHLVSNMWFLWVFGDNVEDSMGRGRYLAFYLACGAAAVLVQYILHPTARIPMIGASGAISGVLGAYMLTYPTARILTLIPIFIFFQFVEIPAVMFLVLWFAMQFLQGTYQVVSGALAQGGVAFWAHVGGFVAGVALVPFFRMDKRARGRFDRLLR